jgi:transcriptional regulator with XRE-family HTH domain
MNKNYIGENIRIYRERKKMTQKDLGEKIGKTWEMVSRYERSVSSPFKQIDSLADALSVDSSDLLKKPSENKQYLLNKVPLFKAVPKNMDFINTKPYEYYTAPDWMLDLDIECFVIDSNLVEIKDEGVRENTYLFISPNSEYVRDSIVLKRQNKGLVVDKRFNTKDADIIGRVLAQEERFV